MSELSQSSDYISMWECLHDGELESLTSDLSARTVTLAIDVPFHWSFHNLPASTRFYLVLNFVRVVEALSFEPWPEAQDIPISIPWKEAEEQRELDSAKGRYESSTWGEFCEQVTNETFRVIDANLTQKTELRLEVVNPNGLIYREVRLHFSELQIYVGLQREVTLKEFQDFGKAYWHEFSASYKNVSEAP